MRIGRASTWLLIAAGIGGVWLLRRQLGTIRLARMDLQLHPEDKLGRTRILARLARAVTEGTRFARQYPYYHPNIAYGTHPRQKLDIYRPSSGSDHPVLLYVHGGGWTGGNKRMYPAVAREFVARGYVVILVNYRLYPPHQYPQPAQDVAAAVRWVVGHISEHGGDPQTVFLSGQSAGAHLVALVALDPRFLSEQQVEPAAIQGVVGMSGPYDLPALANYIQSRTGVDAGEAGLAAIMGGKANLPVASPVNHARPDAPRFLLLHGRDDRLVPCQQSEELATALQSAGAPVEIQVMEATDHLSIVLNLFGRQPEHPFSVAEAIDQFVRGTS